MKSKNLFFNIVVIGCGNIGMRHIEGLGKSNKNFNVYVYDISTASIKKCKKISQDFTNLNLYYYNSIQKLSMVADIFDLAILATTATNRCHHLEYFFSFLNSKHWLIEKPISQSPDVLEKFSFFSNNKNIWVNHAWRAMPYFKNLKSKYFKNKKIEMNIQGNIGISCNISHFVDLINFFTNETPISVNTSKLNKRWINSKRIGFKEIHGSLICEFSRGSKLHLKSNQNYKKFKLSGRIIDTGVDFLIDINNGTFNFNNTVIIPGSYLYQSQLTGIIFDQIYHENKCDLTSLKVSINCYRPVINALLTHWQLTSGSSNDRNVPIT